MTRSQLAAALLLIAMGVACEDDVVCTAYLGAFTVRVTSPEGLVVDRVTAERAGVAECDHYVGSEFICHEQGGGEYTVKVHSGDLVWTDRVTFKEDDDGCHIVVDKEVEIEMTAATAERAQ